MLVGLILRTSTVGAMMSTMVQGRMSVPSAATRAAHFPKTPLVALAE